MAQNCLESQKKNMNAQMARCQIITKASTYACFKTRWQFFKEPHTTDIRHENKYVMIMWKKLKRNRKINKFVICNFQIKERPLAKLSCLQKPQRRIPWLNQYQWKPFSWKVHRHLLCMIQLYHNPHKRY